MADNTLQTGTDTMSTDDVTTLNGGASSGVKVTRSKTGFGSGKTYRDVDAANPLPTQQTDGISKQGMRPDGYSKAFIDPTTLQFDTFETLNLTDSWTAGGTAPTVSGGVLVVAAGVGASAMSYTFSKALFTPGSNAFLNVADLVTMQAAVITGAKCVWGIGLIAGTPTAAVPLSNGAVFEILDTDGALYGAVYSNGVRTQSVALVRPTDGAVHRYAIYYKASRVYFEIDSVSVGSIPFPNPTVAALASVIGTFNGTVAITTAPTLTSSLMGVADTGRNNTKISDGVYPWRMQTIKAPSTSSVATDLAAVVTIHPSTATMPVSAATLPLPTGASTETTLAGIRTDLGTDGTTPPTVLGAGTGVRGWLRSIYEKLTGTLAVTGTFFQATQPVSLATNTPTIAAGTASIGTVQPPAITKGTQGTVGITTQDLKDAGRNAVHYYTVIPVLSTAIDALQTLTGTKGGATVVATATPAVVTTGKNFRITRMAATYIATATSGYGIVRLRAQAAGIVTITSPVYATLAVGSGAPTTANATDTEEATLDEAIEFAAGFGVGISVQGFAAVTATAVGYLLVSLTGYEY